MNRKIKIMLVEDSPAYRKVVTRTLGDDPDLELVSQFGTAEIALRSIQNKRGKESPDIVLLDLNLPGMSGIEALPWFRKYVPGTKVIVLTQSDREADILAAISAGASGYLLKSTTLDQLTKSIQDVQAGGASLDPNVARFILRNMKKIIPKPDGDKPLSTRELEILTLIGEGFLKKEIADQLSISVRTVDSHVAHIYEKLNVQNAPSAVNKAHHLGLFRSK